MRGMNKSREIDGKGRPRGTEGRDQRPEKENERKIYFDWVMLDKCSVGPRYRDA